MKNENAWLAGFIDDLDVPSGQAGTIGLRNRGAA
jgi:hypothetical protein